MLEENMTQEKKNIGNNSGGRKQEQEIKELRIEKWDREDKIDNLQDLYNKL